MEGLEWEKISATKMDMLERRFIEEGIHKAIMKMDGEKSLGQDGFSMAFFKACWEVIKPDLMLGFSEFFER